MSYKKKKKKKICVLNFSTRQLGVTDYQVLPSVAYKTVTVFAFADFIYLFNI